MGAPKAQRVASGLWDGIGLGPWPLRRYWLLVGCKIPHGNLHQRTVSRFPSVHRYRRESCFCVAVGTLSLLCRLPRVRGDFLPSSYIASYQKHASGRPRGCARADHF